jgi:3-phosphoshikimate 1-carboxyvinyltransferase
MIEKSFFFCSTEFFQKKYAMYNCDTHLSSTIEYSAPGSKSMTNRALIMAGMRPYPTEISGFLFAEDSYWGLVALEQCGFLVECIPEKQTVRLFPPEKPVVDNVHLYVEKAGTLARFLPAVILNWQNTFPHSSLCATFSASSQMTKRPISSLLKALCDLGAKIQFDSHSTPWPFQIQNSILEGKCVIDTHESGQFLSGLLLAASQSLKRIEIQRQQDLVQAGYVDMTLRVLLDFGIEVDVTNDKKKFLLLPEKKKKVPDFFSYPVYGDVSTACYFICFSLLHQKKMTLKNIGKKCFNEMIRLLSKIAT